MTSFFSAEDGPIIRFGYNFADWYRMTCRLRWCVEMETRCRFPIWQTFGRIQWHVIPEPRITLQGAATWWIHCHDSRATCHIAGCKNSIRHIENHFSPLFFLFLMQFRLRWAAAFVSSSIHLLWSCYLLATVKNLSTHQNRLMFWRRASHKKITNNRFREKEYLEHQMAF